MDVPIIFLWFFPDFRHFQGLFPSEISRLQGVAQVRELHLGAQGPGCQAAEAAAGAQLQHLEATRKRGKNEGKMRNK